LTSCISINKSNIYRSNFIEGLERDGASFAVFHKGKLVVDLWSGTANTKSQLPWTEDTRTFLFSTTKAISSLCIALMVDRGELNWEDSVSDYWPEYALNGKENTTIQQVLSHQVSLLI
jgi:CubicO group peptidase (beta-lactamase class C family)